MKTSLSQKDRDILFKNQFSDLGFGTHPDDYVQALLYDTNDNLIETSIVESSDYSIENGSVKLKTGTVIRKMGFDRGRYRIKYNFLRKKAGSFETILVDGSNQVYNGPFHVMENGYIMKGEEHVDGAERLFLKENKYIIHEISPSRNEVRIIGQNIDDKKYIDDLFYSGKQRKRETVDFNVKFVTSNPGGTANELKDSLVLQASSDVPTQYLNGLLFIKDAVIQKEIFEVIPDPTQVPLNEIIGEPIQARWVISDTTGAPLSGGNIDAVNDSWKQFSPSEVSVEELRGIFEPDDKSVRDIPFPSPIFVRPSQVKLKSISTKPSEDTLVRYTWTLSGRDFTKSGNINNFITPGNNDAGIVEAGGIGNTQYVEESTSGSEITVKLDGSNTEVGVALKIEAKLKDGVTDAVSEVYLPAILRTKKQ